MNTPPSTRHPSRSGRSLKWVAGLFLFYTIFGFVLLPMIVRKAAVGQLSKQLGRAVAIESVRINPFALSGSIRGLRITDPDGETLLEWQEVYGNFQLSSFFGRPWVFKEVRVIGPRARLRINPDRSLNVSDLIAKFSSPQTNAATPSRPLFLRVGRIHVTNAVLLLSDLTPSTPFRRSVGPVEVKLTGFETSADNRNPYSFVGTTDSGETFTWKGFFSIDPIRSEGEVTLDGLTISRYAALFQDFVRFDFRDGIISANAADHEKMAALLKGLYERPGLQLEIEGSFGPKRDVEGLRRVKLEAEFRRQQWAALPQAEQSKLGPDQMTRTPEEFTNSLNRAYAGIMQAKESATNQIAAGSTNAPSKAAPPKANPTEKGGTRLMTINSRFVPDVPPNEVERTVLATIMVSDDELRQLAEERARRIRDLILASEKVEASRLFLADISSTPSTNRTSRVFFHLR